MRTRAILDGRRIYREALKKIIQYHECCAACEKWSWCVAKAALSKADALKPKKKRKVKR